MTFLKEKKISSQKFCFSNFSTEEPKKDRKAIK
jgi:hypothetical protein